MHLKKSPIFAIRRLFSKEFTHYEFLECSNYPMQIFIFRIYIPEPTTCRRPAKVCEYTFK